VYRTDTRKYSYIHDAVAWMIDEGFDWSESLDALGAAVALSLGGTKTQVSSMLQVNKHCHKKA